jgi:hypothetical protein
MTQEPPLAHVMENPRDTCFSSVTVKSTLAVDQAIVVKHDELPCVKGVLEFSLPATIFMLEVAELAQGAVAATAAVTLIVGDSAGAHCRQHDKGLKCDDKVLSPSR